MNVTELFRQLSYGELSNLSIASEGTGTIVEAKRPQIIAHVNEALLRLYTRFVLKENDLIIRMSDGITNYYFMSRFAATNTDPEPGTTLYIQDTTGDPFQDDLIKVMSVWDADANPYPLNDVDDAGSLFTPQPNLLQVPTPTEGKVLNVLYQARHAILPYDDMEACIEIPAVLEGALRAYVAHLVYKGMNGQENMAIAQSHLDTYNGVCGEITDRDMVNSSVSNTATKFVSRGFV